MIVELIWNIADRGKATEKSCSSAALSTTNPTEAGLVSKSGLRSDRPVNNRVE